MIINKLRITPTPSNTPSYTPTNTPSSTRCPILDFDTTIKLFECNYGQTQVGLPLSGWSVEHSGITYSAITQWTNPNNATWCNIPVQTPFVGASYIFNLTQLPGGWQVCNFSLYNVSWNSFEVVLTSFVGRSCNAGDCVLEYLVDINYYLNGVLQYTAPENIQFTEYLTNINLNCSPTYGMFGGGLFFSVDLIRATNTPTITSTPTMTPSPTSCYNPTAYAIFDSVSGRIGLRDWMDAQGSTWRGFNTAPSSPSTVPATFQAQMNAYISYSGWGVSTYSLVGDVMSVNEDPLIISNTANTFSSDFTWVSIIVPSCAVCDAGEYSLIGDSNIPIYTPEDVFKSINFYYSGSAIPQGFYRFYTTHPSTGMRSASSSSVYSLGDLVCLTPTPSATPTLTPSNTQTITPTRTPSATPTNTPTRSATPTLTPTQTITPTCSTFTTQYMRSEQQGTKDIRFTLFDNPDFTGNANAVCDYTITGTFDIDGGAINQPYTTIMANNDHNHTYDTGSNITGFTITNVVPVCPCVRVVFNQITPTPSATPTLTPTNTQTNTPTGTQTTPTPTQTPSSTPPCTNTIYTHGAVLGTCSDFCNNNYNIHTTDCASEPYGTLSIGDFIYGYTGQSGYLAFSNVYTDTNTGPFRIADIDGSGEILGIYVCSGGSCIPL
jgi:hypothetical protein